MPETKPAPRLAASSRVLVVAAGFEARRAVGDALQHDGLEVDDAAEGPAALAAVAAAVPALVVLDVDLPGMSGLELMTRLRRDEPDLPVVIVTACTSESERVLGLELGADDYVCVPFSPRELAARVRSVLRRAHRSRAADRVVAGPLTILAAERRVLRDGYVVELTPKEFDLLAFLASTPARVFSRAELLREVWGSSVEWQDPSTVTEHVRRLRRRIEVDAAHPLLLQTVRGVGYRFDAGTAA